MKAETTLDAPALWCDFIDDGKVFCCGCDNKGFVWDISTNIKQQIAQHQEPVVFIHWVSEKNIIATGSWDGTVKYWDGRQSGAVSSVDLGAPFVCGDISKNLFVLTTSFPKQGKPQIKIYDLNSPNSPYSQCDSPFPNYIVKVIKCFPNQKGYALGTIEGRVQISSFSSQANDSFVFKCHRNDSQVYSINDISFHRDYGTFATSGSDGFSIIWDKENRTRVKNFKKMPQPITCATFSKEGGIFAYATGYDWSTGPSFGGKDYDPRITAFAPHIYLHEVKDIDVRNKTKT